MEVVFFLILAYGGSWLSFGEEYGPSDQFFKTAV